MTARHRGLGRRGAVAAVPALALALAATACGGAHRAAGPSQPPAAVPSTGRTAALVKAADLPPCPASAGTAGGLPDVTVPCLGGGAAVRVARLGRPAVFNLWATWCRECAAELPLLAAAATTAHDRVIFVGVDTQDSADEALRELAEARVRYPNVYDRRGQVVKRLGLPGLPATVFVRADGTVAYTKLGALASQAELRNLMGTYLGVTG